MKVPVNTTRFMLLMQMDPDGPTVLGLPTCTDLNLVTMNFSMTSHKKESKPSVVQQPICNPDPVAKKEILEQYGGCFEGVGCFQGEFHITVDAAVPSVVHPPCRVLEALKEPLRKELDSLVTQGILAEVTDPTDWVNSLVCVTNNNSVLRLCLDLKDLNRAIKGPHYFTPTLEDILPKLSCARCFSILDSRSGYWNIKLDQESSQCTTFNSPFGRYRFLRLPLASSVLKTFCKGRWMKPSDTYPVSLELQTTLLCMVTMTAIMIRISVLSCNMPVRPAFVLTYNRRQNC